MKSSHIASKTNEEAILTEGFRGGMRCHHAGQEWTGVWASSDSFNWVYRQYLNYANAFVIIEIPEDVISEFEWVEERKTIREWLILVSLLGSYGWPVVEDVYQDDEIIVHPDPEEDELLIEWANERPNVERFRTGLIIWKVPNPQR